VKAIVVDQHEFSRAFDHCCSALELAKLREQHAGNPAALNAIESMHRLCIYHIRELQERLMESRP
jgi:hypothetical protein